MSGYLGDGFELALKLMGCGIAAVALTVGVLIGLGVMAAVKGCG